MDNARSDFMWLWEHVTEGTQVQTGPGALHTVVINQMGTKGNITLFDGIGAAGNVIGVIITEIHQPETMIYDEDFTTGLYVLPADGDDLTVTYV